MREQALSVVLVHGAWADGSGWRPVYDLLKREGLHVRVAQIPTISLDDDVSAVNLILNDLDGPVVLVGHSYGGVVITEMGNQEKVASLVYVAGWVPDQNESIAALIADPPPDLLLPPILPPKDGFVFLDREKFPQAFAADLPLEQAAFMADAQLPWGVAALNGVVTEPAWRSKPSSYLITTEDQMIPPALQQTMAERAGSSVSTVQASHAVYISKPDAVANVIISAVRE